MVYQVRFAMSVNRTVASVADEDFRAVNLMKRGTELVERIRMRSTAGIPYDYSLEDLARVCDELNSLAERNENLPPRFVGMLMHLESLIGVLEEIAEKPGMTGTDIARIQLLIERVSDELSTVMVQTSENMAEAFRELRQKTVHSYAVMGVGSAMSFLLAFLIATRLSFKIARPIDLLYEATEEVAEGNLDVSSKVESNDELGRLAKGFNHMIERLRYYREINDSRLLRTMDALRTIMDRMPDAVMVVDEEMGISFKNPVAEQMLGHREFENAFPDNLVATIRAGFGSRNPNIRRQLAEAVLMRLSGEVRYFLVHTFPFEAGDLVSEETPEGTAMGDDRKTLAVMLQDVTAMQLSDRLKTDLVATVSHELKTPITSARMALYLLLEEQIGVLNEEQKTLATTARDDLERQLAMIDHLLSFTRFESKIKPEPHQSTRIRQLLQECIHSHGPLARSAGVAVAADFAEEDIQIETDPNGLKVVVNNLLGNAIKYSPEMSQVRVGYGWGEDHTELVISVVDNGLGIPVERMGSLFEPYTRGEHDAKVSGTGLGLNIAKNIVEGFDGRIWCESKVGKGSCFYVALPMRSELPGIRVQQKAV